MLHSGALLSFSNFAKSPLCYLLAGGLLGAALVARAQAPTRLTFSRYVRDAAGLDSVRLAAGSLGCERRRWAAPAPGSCPHGFQLLV